MLYPVEPPAHALLTTAVIVPRPKNPVKDPGGPVWPGSGMVILDLAWENVIHDDQGRWATGLKN